MSSGVRRVLVGGGTGLVGKHLTKALAARGYDVVIISRKPQQQQPQSATSEQITWQEVERDGLPECHAVINLAGASVLNLAKRWSDAAATEVLDSRISTTSLLSKAIAAASPKPKVFVTASGVGVYPAFPTAEASPEVDESAACGSDFFAKLVREWEAAAQPAVGAGVRHVAMRTGAVLAPDGGVVAQAKLPFLLGLGGPFGSGQQLFPWCHIQDVVNMYIHAMETESLQGPVNLVAPTVATNAEYTQAFAKAVHRFAIVPMPAFVIRALFGPDLATMLLCGQRVVPRKALDSGFTFSFPTIDKAMHDVVVNA
ncbi:hypothetical protein PTSG_12672 [Salpingoeca rosetta]|uniref:Epimerase family protein SDR39U1 n=1 Tax=Salpingoeca rosetta (strain ATCC 50818 / BSB-021) TaxID=946362 RepID=F2UHS4_SALR5|nr:uncharacterized protein PTSG_12672 [Salpingoeca rosetta]EGD76673.1 hypothetical protein PTSG_12672 [Salpingoeca rosetta]|eukprot:XP_004991045.1 hypothetical protein PTSG_12672 [Salpingoeca rosetta]